MTGALLFCLGILAACADNRVTVEYVVDGDTVILEDRERVRLIGINAPEKEREDMPAQPFSLEARLALAEFVEKRKVDLVRGKESRDRYGRLLAYLMLEDGLDVQAEMIRRGYAMAVAFPPNIDFLEAYAAAENDARRENQGLWSSPYFAIRNLDQDDSFGRGFNRVSGRVTLVAKSRNNVRITISDRVTVLIYHNDWEKFFGARDPEKLLEKVITVRGWINGHGKEQLMRIHHPFMFEEIR